VQALDDTAALRPFGAAEDLEVDFATDETPALVTALLACCAAPQDATFWWRRSVGERTAVLLRLMAATSHCRSVELASRCSAPGCGADFGFELQLEPLVTQAAGDDPIDIALDDNRLVSLRRPTGEDQRAWRASLDPACSDAIPAMLQSLLLRGEPRVGDVVAIARAMSERDPLVDFSVACHCPACGAQIEVSVDLEAVALKSLKTSQRALLRDVHDFARHYGWTESETLAVPQRRRALYRALIEESV
jgi:hypothetical protein